MATIINLGKIKFEFRGDYSNTVTYNVDDIVVYQNAKFIYKNSTSAANQDPLIRDTNWQYAHLGEVHDPAMKKFKVNTSYWDYFESENQFGEYVGNWSNSTIYLTGQVVTGHSGAAYYAKRTSKGDDPVLNYYGTWEVYLEGGPVLHDRKITRFISENPVGWRGHPKLRLHANTGWANTWQGNIPQNTYGANGQVEFYNNATPGVGMNTHGGFVGVKWDGTIAGWGWGSYYGAPYGKNSSLGGDTVYPYDPNTASRFYYNSAVKTSPLYGGHEGAASVTADEYSLPALQNIFDTPGTAGWPTIVSISGGVRGDCLMSDGTVLMGAVSGYNATSTPGSGSKMAEHGVGGWSYAKEDFGGKKIVKLSSGAGDHATSAPSTMNHGHAIALDEDGEIWVWGDNTYGQCGVGPEANTTSYILGNAAGADGDPRTSALGGFGEDNVTDVSTPIKIPMSQFENERIVDCWATGETYGISYVLTQSGYLWSWGYNNYGQLGHRTDTGTTTATHCTIPRKIDIDWNIYGGIQKIVISCWERYASIFILDGHGHVWSWGYNASSILGKGDATNHNNTVNVAANPTNYRRVSWPTGNNTVNIWATNHYTHGNLWIAQANGSVYGVGDNSDYQLNNDNGVAGSTTDQSTPVIATDISFPIKIHADNSENANAKNCIMCLTKDRDILVMPMTASYPTGIGKIGENNTNTDIAQRDGAGSRNPAVSPTGRSDVSQYGWKEISVPSYMHKEGSKPIDVRADGVVFAYSTSSYLANHGVVLTQDGRLKHFGNYSSTVISDGRSSDAMCLSDYMYWGS